MKLVTGEWSGEERGGAVSVARASREGTGAVEAARVDVLGIGVQRSTSREAVLGKVWVCACVCNNVAAEPGASLGP